MNIERKLAEEFNIRASQVESTVKLIDEGNDQPTVCFFQAQLHCIVTTINIAQGFPILVAIKIEFIFIRNNRLPCDQSPDFCL